MDRTYIRTVAETASAVRSFLEPRWIERRGQTDGERGGIRMPPSASMCRFSSIVLADILSQETGRRWTVHGGTPLTRADAPQIRGSGDGPERDGGMKDTSGIWAGHYWAFDPESRVIADVTADQFGWPPVIVAAVADPRYNGNYLAHAVRGHVARASRTARAWLRDWDTLGSFGSPPPRF